ncbi:MAG: serine/threonine protein kinase [Deltaproteobacteria bacterium]|nr:MAG: serine/threonine protein kinase [Deltaproteobacteria bacterium]
MPSRTVAHYEIIDELGQGGMAVVYRARDGRLRRDVALKILHEHIASREENRVRFEREATAAARLQHPNIVQVYACAEPSAEVGWLATELVDGFTLRTFVEDTGFRHPVAAVLVGVVLADALAHAHERGVIHRDIKPENIMISREGTPKLMDFGLARVLDDQRLTMTGSLLGSPAHMSPEMIEGEELRPTSDIFALGTVLYFMATGRLPFEGNNPAVVLNAILRGDFPPASAHNPRVDAPLDDLINTCLARRVEDRFASAQDLREALDQYLRTLGITDHRRELAAFFRHPDAWLDDLLPRLVDRLLDLGRAARDERRTGALLRICDRILTLDPHQPDALGWVAGVEAGRRRRRVGLLLAGIAATSALVVALVLLPSTPTADDPSPDPALPAQAQPTQPDPEELERHAAAIRQAFTRIDRPHQLALRATVRQNASRSVTEAVRAAHHASLDPIRASLADLRTQPRPTSPRPRTTPAEAAAPTETAETDLTEEPTLPPEPEPEPGIVQLRIWPLTAVILVNGTSVGTAQELDGPLRLPPGRHHIVARLPELGTQAEQTVTVESGRRIDVPLVVPWRPARITVDASIASTVFLDGRRAGRSREPIDVTIDGRQPQRTIHLQVIPDDTFGQPWETRLTVRTGEDRRIDAPF